MTSSTASPRKPRPFPRWLQWSWLIALLAFPLILWILPADHFDEGQSLCPSMLLFNTECPGCGSTRAIQHLHHLEWEEALYYHSAAPFIYLFLGALWTYYVYTTTKRLGLLGRQRAMAYEQELREEAERRSERKRKLFQSKQP